MSPKKETKFHKKISMCNAFTDNHQEESATALAELENIDTQADKVGIAFVKINDLELVSEFGLGNLPSLVYYRHTTPIVYDGEIINYFSL